MTEARWNAGPGAEQPPEIGPEDLSTGDVRRAVREERVFLVYQPVFSLEPRRLVGGEALARWLHRDLGMVPPDRFIPVVEELGLMTSLSRRLLPEACASAREWPNAGPASRNGELLLQFNFGASELDDGGLAADIDGILREEDFPPRRLRLELAGEAVWDYPRMVRELAQLGVSIMIHDYGVKQGQALADEESMGIDAVKIDRSIIRGLGRDPSVAETVERAVALGRRRGLEVVAEGVETEAQVWHLQRLDCQLGQGFQLGSPMRADQFQQFCEERWR